MNATILLFGGRSEERLVSVASAQNLAHQYQFSELWFIAADGAITRTPAAELFAHQRPFEMPFKPTVAQFSPSLRHAVTQLRHKTVFIGLHGTEGEDGSLQSELENAGVAFTGSGSVASHNCFDKMKAKRIVSTKGIAVAPQAHLPNLPATNIARTEIMPKIHNELSTFLAQHGKIILKPVESGSSFGLFVLTSEDEIKKALVEIVKSPYERYLAEKFITGRELTVGVLSDGHDVKPLPASEVILTAGHQFDYEGKYLGRGSKEVTPAVVTESELKAAQALALQAHTALGCAGYSRTDMILTPQGPLFLETNTLPGLTKASFLPQQLEAAGLSMKGFIETQLKLAETRPSATVTSTL